MSVLRPGTFDIIHQYGLIIIILQLFSKRYIQAWNHINIG